MNQYFKASVESGMDCEHCQFKIHFRVLPRNQKGKKKRKTCKKTGLGQVGVKEGGQLMRQEILLALQQKAAVAFPHLADGCFH
jgi:hypothetical protein